MGINKFSRVQFLKISRVVQNFHGYFFRFFHGSNIEFSRVEKLELSSISLLKPCIFFTPKRFVFHGLNFADFSREGFLFHGLFLRFFHGKNQAFTGYKNFFTGKKRNNARVRS